MVIGILRISVFVADSRSLKDKRAVIRSLKGRIESRFKVSVAEVGERDHWQQGLLAVVCVSNDSRHADEMLGHIGDFVIANPGDGEIEHIETELLHLD